MLGYLIRRCLQAIPVLLGVSFLVVASARLVPGSPGQAYLGERGSKEKIRELNEAIGWYDPVPVQWWRFVGRAARGDLGTSFYTKRPIAEELSDRVPASFELAIAAMVIAVPLGMSLGVVSALARRFPWSMADHALTALALVGISMPVFWLGLLLQIYVYPTQQRLSPQIIDFVETTGLYLLDAALAGNGRVLADALRHLALPALALSTIPLAVITRMTRSTMLDVLGHEFVRTARAKGLHPARVAVRHALRNALIPVVTVVGLQLAALMGGAVLTETVFEWPGLGRYIVHAAERKDLPALQGAVLFVAAVFVAVNLLVDLSYAWLDPRIRLGGGRGGAR